MNVTDPIADMLTRIRNASLARHRELTLPSSRIKRDIARILVEEGFIESYATSQDGVQELLTIQLKYVEGKTPVVSGLKRISKPGLRVYAKSTGLPKVLGGLGIAIISTSQGLLTDKQAHNIGVGGEVVAYVW